MSEREDLLIEALQKTETIVDTIDGRYRDAAFPIILQKMIKAMEVPYGKDSEIPAINQQETAEFKLSPKISVNEFFREAKPDSHPGRFVCAAYYLLHTGKAEHFTQSDILEVYGKLREPKPKNSSDVINQCIRKVHIIDGPTTTDKQKTWVITPEGEKYVEGLLNDNATVSNSPSR